MATKFARTTGGNWSADATWSTTSGGAADTTKPTAADDVRLDANSGNVTIDAASVCRSLDCTGYPSGKTLTHNAFSCTIGDGTAGASNIALKLVSAMTYTVVNNTAAAFNFVSTSATVQTIDTAGKNTGSMQYNGSGGKWQFISTVTATTVLGSTLNLTQGTLDLNGQTVNFNIMTVPGTLSRTLTMGAANITLNWAGAGAFQCTSSTGLTVTANTATMTLNGSGTSFTSATVNWNGLSVVITGSGATQINATGAFTIKNLTITGTAQKDSGCSVVGPFNLASGGVLTLTGNARDTNRLYFGSNALGFQRTITLTGCTVHHTNVDFRDIGYIGSPTVGTTSSVGNAGGNANITFTTAFDHYWIGGTGNWDDTAHWSTASGGSGGSIVPLCHDNVFLDGSSGGGTVTQNNRFACLTLNATGFTGTIASSYSAAASWHIYGDLICGSGMTWSGTFQMSVTGRGTRIITTNGVTFTMPFFVSLGNPYTLQDNFTSTYSGAGAFNVGNLATFSDGGKTITLNGANSSFVTNTFVGVTLTMTGILNLGGTGAITIFSIGSGVTITATAWTVNITNASANARTFDGNGKVLGDLNYTVAGSTGKLTMVGSNSFNNFAFSDVTNARTLEFTAGTTTTIRGSFLVNGTTGKLMTIQSVTAASPFTLTKADGQVSCDYLSVKDSTATGDAAWYAGANSTNVSGNTGWLFRAASGILKVGGQSLGKTSKIGGVPLASIATVGGTTY